MTAALAAGGLSQIIPRPEDVLGFKPGDDYHLAT
jgi:hypothetical protein